MSPPRRPVAWAAGVAAALALLALATGPALAHGGSLGAESRQAVTVPTWLVLMTGGAAVGASFLLASLVTDRRLIEAVDAWRRVLAGDGLTTGTPLRLTRAAGVLLLAVTVALCFLAPQAPLANFGLLFVWVGWWAGFTMSTYLVGNTWPAVNPWRTIASPLPSLGYTYPVGLGLWPATVALLALIWVEVVSPIADEPAVLGGVILVYSVLTLSGAVVFGVEDWFGRADPIARVFHHYGHVAPLSRDADGVSVSLPAARLTDLGVRTRSEVAFVVALLWGTTFDGFVSTPAWRSVVDAFGFVPLSALYPLALAAGFGVFLLAFDAATRASKRISGTYLTRAELARQFAPPLLAIAAGYHLAHYLGYFLSLSPALAVVAAAPLNPPIDVPLLALPGWFETVGMLAILVGHVLAIWAAHTTAYDIFPGRLQAIRSQYPYIAVMVFYTMTSLWIIAQPEVPPP
ncbi:MULTISPECIES: hypothetical protein [Salinibaculum]|uniref:hypothetical protein n=1 Tax=Salinibaculum TaxID=2732368 RepID=UPI0030CDDDAD